MTKITPFLMFVGDYFGKAMDGLVMMPVDNYGYSTIFGWAADKYGVSWQLSVA